MIDSVDPLAFTLTVVVKTAVPLNCVFVEMLLTLDSIDVNWASIALVSAPGTARRSPTPDPSATGLLLRCSSVGDVGTLMAFWVLLQPFGSARVDCRPVAEPVDTTSLGSEATAGDLGQSRRGLGLMYG